MAKDELIWSNLKKNLCPKCDGDFMRGMTKELRRKKRDLSDSFVSGVETIGPAPVAEVVFIHPCGFKIRERRYTEIVNDMVNSGLKDYKEEDQDNG